MFLIYKKDNTHFCHIHLIIIVNYCIVVAVLHIAMVSMYSIIHVYVAMHCKTPTMSTIQYMKIQVQHPKCAQIITHSVIGCLFCTQLGLHSSLSYFWIVIYTFNYVCSLSMLTDLPCSFIMGIRNRAMCFIKRLCSSFV